MQLEQTTSTAVVSNETRVGVLVSGCDMAFLFACSVKAAGILQEALAVEYGNARARIAANNAIDNQPTADALA